MCCVVSAQRKVRARPPQHKVGSSPHTRCKVGASPHTPGIFLSQRTGGGGAFYQKSGMTEETNKDIVRFSGMPIRMKSVKR
jgi:hypothetical protein